MMFLLSFLASCSLVELNNPSKRVKSDLVDELTYNWIALKSIYLNYEEVNDFDSYNIYNRSEVERLSTSDYRDVYAMYNDMSDEFTRYFDPQMADEISELIFSSGDTRDLGIRTRIINDSVVVMQSLENSPSDKAGVKVKDKILSVNYNLLGEISPEELIEQISLANEDSYRECHMTFLRGDSVFAKDMVPDSYELPSVFVDTLDTDIATVEVTGFSGYTTDTLTSTSIEFKEAFESLSRYDNVIIDLRDNPGGLIIEALKMGENLFSSGDFLLKEVRMVAPEDIKDDPQKETTIYLASADSSFNLAKDKKLVVLMNSNTASSSEILISMLKNLGDAKLIGEKSYGKGIGQSVNSTVAGGISIITTLQVYDENDASWHLNGFDPDYPSEDAMVTAYQYFRGGVTLAKTSALTKTTSVKKENVCNSSGLERLKCGAYRR